MAGLGRRRDPLGLRRTSHHRTRELQLPHRSPNPLAAADAQLQSTVEAMARANEQLEAALHCTQATALARRSGRRSE
jgi:hypothetical protein